MSRAKVSSGLLDLEAELRRLDLWQGAAPSVEALASTQPFGIDTLTFPQWLQFIFLPRMRSLIEQQQPLPVGCGIAPMAVEYFKGLSLNTEELVLTMEEFDRLLS